MDQDLKKELQRLKCLAILNFVEIQHLKNRLSQKLKIPEHDPDGYTSGLHAYIEQLKAKTRNLIKEYPTLLD